MNRKTALVRLDDDRGRAASGLGRRLLSGASSLLYRVAGDDFDQRVQRVGEERAEVDPFGFEVEWIKWALLSVSVLYRHYFRVDVRGIENVPKGRVLLISNHSGQVPIDAAVIAASLFYDAEPPRIVRSMVEKWSQTLPFVSVFFSRCGQVVGVPENARRLLELNEALLVFPEGAKGISKPFSQRYQLKEFGLGFMRLALETRAPIVPIAVIGAEEQYINLGNIRALAKTFGMPVFPVVPQFLLPGAQMPLPTRYRIYYGEPLRFQGDPDDEDAVIQAKVDIVRATIQSMIIRGLKERKHIFW